MKTLFKPLKPTLLYVFLALITGIFCGNIFPESKSAAVTSTFLFFFLSCLFYYYNKKKIFVFILGLAFSLSFLSIQSKLYPELPLNHISNFLDSDKFLITGKIVSLKKHYEKKYKIILLCQTVKIKNRHPVKVTGKINLSMYKLSQTVPEFGDIIEFKASIRSIRNFMNPGAFDYKKFLKFQDIYGTAYISTSKIKILKDTKISVKSIVIRSIEKLRNNFYYFILKQTNNSNAGKIIISLVTGKKELISHDLRDLFSKAGISHLLAISGLHLSIVSFLSFFIFFKLLSIQSRLLITGRAKKIAGIFTIFPLLWYAFFTGFSPSTQRAFIMIIVFIFAFICEREKDFITSLSAAGIIILIIDPPALFSISFQLSFIAVIFIICGISLIQGNLFLQNLKILNANNIVNKIFLMICISFFAGLGTSPLTAYYFNMVSTIALVSNTVFIPLIGFIVLPLGLIAFVIFLISPQMAGVLIMVCEKLIFFSILISKTLITMPFSWSRVLALQWTEIMAIYSFFTAIYFLFKGHKKRTLIFISFSSFLILFGFLNNNIQKKNEQDMEISIIDVGQGNSALIQTPAGENILVDAGGFPGTSSFDTGRFIIAPYLWKKRITTLDYVILSHPEADHLNGMVFILQNFKVYTLIKNADIKNTHAYMNLIKICKEKDIRIWNPTPKKDNFKFNKIKLIFYGENSNSYPNDFNNNSLVFKLVYKDFSILFPGDILKQREKNLSEDQNINLRSDVLLSPHHGSNSSSGKLLLDKVDPKSVVISCGWHNRYGFPHYKVLQRYDEMGIKIFRTDEQGAIFISSNGKDYHIKTYRGE